MKQLLASIAITSVVFFSCSKSNFSNQTDTSLNGKWRMMTIKDNGSLVLTTKPAYLQGEVEITFTAISATTGTFTGITPSNDIWTNDLLNRCPSNFVHTTIRYDKSWGITLGISIC